MWDLKVGRGKTDSIICRVMETGWSFWRCSWREVAARTFWGTLYQGSVVKVLSRTVTEEGVEASSFAIGLGAGVSWSPSAAITCRLNDGNHLKSSLLASNYLCRWVSIVSASRAAVQAIQLWKSGQQPPLLVSQSPRTSPRKESPIAFTLYLAEAVMVVGVVRQLMSSFQKTSPTQSPEHLPAYR